MLGVTGMRPMIASVPRQGKPLPRPSSVSTLPGCNSCASQSQLSKPYLRHVLTYLSHENAAEERKDGREGVILQEAWQE